MKTEKTKMKFLQNIIKLYIRHKSGYKFIMY